jgi:hypothetical protein
MEYPQLKMTAAALWGFVPEWSSALCAEIMQRIEAAGTTPAVYLRTVATNKKVPSQHLAYRNVILSPKWDDFLEEELQQMQAEAKVKFDADLVEFRNAYRICRGDHRKALEDANFELTDLGRYRIALLYGFPEIAAKFEVGAKTDELANPCLVELYDKLQEDANVE